jgi:DNA-binding XRE family transcriptional regulator
MDYLRKYRKAQGINQVDMAKKVGIKFPTYRTMEQVGLGSFDNIKKVIRYTSTLLKKKGRRNER